MGDIPRLLSSLLNGIRWYAHKEVITESAIINFKPQTHPPPIVIDASLWPDDLKGSVCEVHPRGVEHQELATGVHYPHLLHPQPVSPQPLVAHATHQGVHHLLARPKTLRRGDLQEQVTGVRVNLHRNIIIYA